MASTRSVGPDDRGDTELGEKDEEGEKGTDDEEAAGEERNMGWPWGAAPEGNTIGCATGMRATADEGETGKDDEAAGEPNEAR